MNVGYAGGRMSIILNIIIFAVKTFLTRYFRVQQKERFYSKSFPCSFASRNAFPVHSGIGPSGQTDATESRK